MKKSTAFLLLVLGGLLLLSHTASAQVTARPPRVIPPVTPPTPMPHPIVSAD